MKIDAVETITNSQHRLLAESARKQTAPEHDQTHQARRMEENGLKAPLPSDHAGRSLREDHREAERFPQRREGQGDARSTAETMELQAMASQVKADLAEAGVVPAPSRYAGIPLVTPTDIAEAARGEDGRISALHKAQLVMVRQLLRHMSGRELQVSTPRELAVEQARLEDTYAPSPAPPASPETGEAHRTPSPRPWVTGGVLHTEDGHAVDFTLRADFDSERFGSDEGISTAPERLELDFDAPAEAVESTRFEFHVHALTDTQDAETDLLKVYAGPSGDRRLVAVGDTQNGAIYVGHLLATAPAGQTVPHAPNTSQADTYRSFDLSL